MAQQVEVQGRVGDLGVGGGERGVDQPGDAEGRGLGDAEQHRELVAAEAAGHREDHPRRRSGSLVQGEQLGMGEIGEVAGVAAGHRQRRGAQLVPVLIEAVLGLAPGAGAGGGAGDDALGRDQGVAGHLDELAVGAAAQGDVVQLDDGGGHGPSAFSRSTRCSSQ